MAADSSTARKQFEVENEVKSVDPDSIFFYNKEEQREINNKAPWKSDPNWFTEVKISAVALLKMVMHARSGGRIEVMGMMQGKIDGHSFVVMDVFALPVEGTETRVNASAQGYEYMSKYMSSCASVGRLENVVGWYHSHPEYGCWLSGIDVGTQMLHQQYEDPYLAVVVDPTRTCTAGKVDIGAFRTYPEGYTPPNAAASEYQSIPLAKIEDFGSHANQYYPIPISYFKSTTDEVLLDMLWNKYWVSTLSSNPLLNNRDYFASTITDLSEKLDKAEEQLGHSGRMGGYFVPDKRKEDSQLAKITADAVKSTVEQINGLTTQVLKDILFNPRMGEEGVAAAAEAEPAAAAAGGDTPMLD